MDSIDYYDQNVEEFIAGTVNVDMSSLYNRFLGYIPEGGILLDAGCGAGRDTKFFIDHGYRVIAMDGSAEMVAKACEFTGQPVRHQKFSDIDDQNTFDGVWACASILHVPKSEMARTINRLRTALKTNGVLYLSYKYGEGEAVRKNRHFSNYTEHSFNELLQQCDSLHVIEMWTTTDVRPGRKTEKWLNLLLRKAN